MMFRTDYLKGKDRSYSNWKSIYIFQENYSGRLENEFETG